MTKGDVDKRGRTLFVNFWLENKRTSDTIQMRGDKGGKKSTRNQRNCSTKHTDYGNTEVLRVREILYLSDYSSYSSADEVYENCAYYDDYGNLLYTSTPMGEEKYIYDDALRLTGYQNQADYDTSNNTMSFAYDGFGRVTSYTDRLGNTQNATYKTLSTEYSFTPKGSSTPENNYVENFDIYGNKVSETIYPDGLGGDSLTSTYEYDLLGNVLKITDANGKITSMTYDEVNNPTEIVLADGNNISYDYTKWNSVKTTTQYDGEQSYTISETFDDRGLATSHRQTGVAIKTKPWYYSYRTDGLISMSVAPDGTERSYEYDASGNTTGYSVGAISDEMAYDHFGNLDKIIRRVNGTETGATDYVYDSAKGWLNSKTTGLGTTSYTYNTTGMLTSVTSPDGLVRTYTRDANDRITSVSTDDKDFTYTYYGDGLIKSITYPGGNIVTSYTYDNANRLTKLETKNGNNVLKTYSYEYDGVGNIISVSGSENAEYTYDDLYRLATSTQNGHTTTYEYDSRNNLISETRTDGYTKTYEYSGDNRLVKTVENGVETAYEYDLRGNLVKRGEDEFAYNSNDNLVYANVNGVETTYEIGEDGLRKSKTVNGVTTTYSIDENGNVITEGNDEIILGNVPLAKKIGDNFYYYIYNAHGDVVMIVDESGNVQNTYEYDAWGVVINETETIVNSHKYAGEYYDTETGLIYLRARYYDPSDRRFTQEDPVRDERNWYSYCNNNPLLFVDENGNQPWYAEKIKKWCEDLSVVKWFYNATRDGKLDWIYNLVGFTRDKSGVFHAKKDAWQQYFGYNKAYDAVFDVATDMKSENFTFSTSKKTFTIWLWKGDYLNLGNGAEIGIYLGDAFHLKCATSYKLPIVLKLYNTDTDKKIFEYSSTTWWATGFNPKYHGVDSDNLKMKATIDFSKHSEMYTAFKRKYSDDPILSFNDDNKKVTINW